MIVLRLPGNFVGRQLRSRAGPSPKTGKESSLQGEIDIFLAHPGCVRLVRQFPMMRGVAPDRPELRLLLPPEGTCVTVPLSFR